jgi:1-phosphofructokinase family hexose kinase
MVNTLTLNPAMDRNLYLNGIVKGITNRAHEYIDTVGGKGTHVSMNLSQLGLMNRAFGVAHGETGLRILAGMERFGVITRFVCREENQSRTNYVLIDEKDKSCTTISEKGVALTERDFEDLLALMQAEIAVGDTLVFSGDASNCPDPFIYNRIAAELRDKKLKLFVDASGETLRKSLEFSPYLIKPNQNELEDICGFKISGENDVLRAIASLDSYGIGVVAVSLGKKGAVVRFGGETYRTVPPEVEVASTAGCGDSFLAAILFGCERGMPHDKTLRLATAVSSATAASMLSVGYDGKLAEELLKKSVVERIQ